MPDTACKPTRLVATLPGVIDPAALYTAEEARRRLRLGAWAWRRWRRDGLPVLRVSGRAFVLGADILEFVRKKGATAEVAGQ